MSPKVSAVFDRWVLATSIGDDERKLTEYLPRHSGQLAAAFRKAIVEDPPRE
jgi:hypothetical protein